MNNILQTLASASLNVSRKVNFEKNFTTNYLCKASLLTENFLQCYAIEKNLFV